MSAKEVKLRFFEDNPDFSEIPADSLGVTVGDIDDINELEDEIWLMQCPKGIDISLLEGEKLKFPGRTTLEQDLEIVSMEYTEPKKYGFGFTNRKGHYDLRLLPICGNAVVRKKLKANGELSAEVIINVGGEKPFIPYMPNLRVRHPLMGAEFDKKVSVPKHISARLSKADEDSLKIMHETKIQAQREKLKNNKRIKEEIIEIEDENKADKMSLKGKKRKSDCLTEKKAREPKKINNVSEDLKWIADL